MIMIIVIVKKLTFTMSKLQAPLHLCIKYLKITLLFITERMITLYCWKSNSILFYYFN